MPTDDVNNAPNNEPARGRDKRETSLMWICGLEVSGAGSMNGSAKGFAFASCANCFRPSWENFVHAIFGKYASGPVFKTTPMLSAETISPLAFVPSTNE